MTPSLYTRKEEHQKKNLDMLTRHAYLGVTKAAIGAAHKTQREDVMEKVNEILDEKAKAGPAAYLWLHSLSGDCILWPDEESSIDDDGRNAIERWQLTAEESEELIETGEVDEVA